MLVEVLALGVLLFLVLDSASLVKIDALKHAKQRLQNLASLERAL